MAEIAAGQPRQQHAAPPLKGVEPSRRQCPVLIEGWGQKLDRHSKSWQQGSKRKYLVLSTASSGSTTLRYGADKDSGRKARSASAFIDLRQLQRLCRSRCPGAPEGAVDLQVREGKRTFTFVFPADTAAEWRTLLSASVPCGVRDAALTDELEAALLAKKGSSVESSSCAAAPTRTWCHMPGSSV